MMISTFQPTPQLFSFPNFYKIPLTLALSCIGLNYLTAFHQCSPVPTQNPHIRHGRVHVSFAILPSPAKIYSYGYKSFEFLTSLADFFIIVVDQPYSGIQTTYILIFQFEF